MSDQPPPDPDPRHQRFVDPSGKNRFSDDDAVPAVASSENPYAPSLTPGLPAHEIAQFETTQTSRGNLMLTLSGLGWIGLILAATGWLQSSGWGFPPGAIAVVLGVVSLWLAYDDLGAMQAGAMESSGKRKTEAAFWLSVLQILLLCLLTAVFAWQRFQSEET